MMDENLWILYINTSLWVRRLFKDKVDKGGTPYIEHLLFVSSKMSTLEGKILGLLHDSVEDIKGITIEVLLEKGYPPTLLEALKLVTRDKSTPYEQYIDKIATSNNLLAKELKKCDLEHNMDISRLQSPTEKDYQRMQKYNRSYNKINESYQAQLNEQLRLRPYQKYKTGLASN